MCVRDFLFGTLAKIPCENWNTRDIPMTALNTSLRQHFREGCWARFQKQSGSRLARPGFLTMYKRRPCSQPRRQSNEQSRDTLVSARPFSRSIGGRQVVSGLRSSKSPRAAELNTLHCNNNQISVAPASQTGVSEWILPIDTLIILLPGLAIRTGYSIDETIKVRITEVRD